MDNSIMSYVKLTRNENILIGNYPADGKDVLVELDSSAGAFAVELPELSTWAGRAFTFWNKGTGANTVTLNTRNGEPIDAIGTFSITVAAGAVVTLQSNGIDKILSL
jgi:hypothetical protein